MRITAHIEQRDLSGPGLQPSAPLRVLSYSHRALGGPQAATLEARGDEATTWELVERLRCPVLLRDELGQPVWWGYVAAVTIQGGAVRYGVSLDRMANRVRVTWVDGAGDDQATAWEADAESVATYGVKEHRAPFNLEGVTSEMAEAMRATLLQQRRWPPATLAVRDEEPLTATVECRGWWSTLDWQYYELVGAGSQTIADQIEALAAEAQFLTGALLDGVRAYTSPASRSGSETLREVLARLLALGDVGDRRLLARIDAGRVLHVYREPAVGAADGYLRSDGTLEDQFGSPLPRHTCPVARWVRLKDVIPAPVSSTRLADPSALFIEESEYLPPSGRLRIYVRNDPTPWDVIGGS